jgi:hypothetical protein
VETDKTGQRSFWFLYFLRRLGFVAQNISFFELLDRSFIPIIQKFPAIVGWILIDFLSSKGQGIFRQVNNL